MASNSKRSRDDKTKFSEAEKNWNLEKLYEDLKAAKQRCASARTKILTETEKCYLRGLLCGRSDKVIANERGVVVGTVNDALSKTLYCYIEELLDYKKKIRHWSDVPDFLEQAGYKIQVSEQFKPSHRLPDEKENILEASHKIGVTSFLEYFSKSIDQLKSKDRDVRIGAISTLGTLAKYSSLSEHWTIMEYLAAFIRSNAPRKEEEEGERSPKIPEDIQAALTVIGRRDPKKDPKKQWLNLGNTNLAGVDLSQLNFEQVDFTGANLKGANLSRASLKGVDFEEANLEGVNLNGADLESAKLFQTVLSKANLRGVCLEKAILIQTDLSLAYLERANLKGARFDKANLKEADLSGANLSESYLNNANLEGVKLTSVKSVVTRPNQISVTKPNQIKVTQVNMEGAVLYGAKLKGANFSKAKNLDLRQLSLAYGDSTTVLPDYVQAPPHWM